MTQQNNQTWFNRFICLFMLTFVILLMFSRTSFAEIKDINDDFEEEEIMTADELSQAMQFHTGKNTDALQSPSGEKVKINKALLRKDSSNNYYVMIQNKKDKSHAFYIQAGLLWGHYAPAHVDKAIARDHAAGLGAAHMVDWLSSTHQIREKAKGLRSKISLLATPPSSSRSSTPSPSGDSRSSTTSRARQNRIDGFKCKWYDIACKEKKEEKEAEKDSNSKFD